MATMRAVQVAQAKGPLELVERPIPEPHEGRVRIKVEACGVCHSDSLTKEGGFPGLTFPRVPGHEVIGVIDRLGPGVEGWTEGQRVGVGWNGGYCGRCDPCRRGLFLGCKNSAGVTGVHFDGGYAEYTVAPASAVAAVPEELEPADAAPLMCAGLTTFNALRNSGAVAGDLVAVHGLGGLGHLGVQYAAKMGFRKVGIARGADKADFARQLGAWKYIDSQAEDPATALQALGGAKVIIATVTDGKAMASVMGGLGLDGTLMVIGAPHSLEVSPGLLIAGRRRVQGWYSGMSIDSQDTLAFSRLAGVKSMNESFSLEQAPAAYERMMSGKARFRVVLRMATA